MPLGSRQYFDLAGPMSEYEDALMQLAGAQRSAQRMKFPQFLAGLGDLMRDWEQRKWQRSVQEQQMGMRERELGLGERRVEMMEPYYEAQTERLGRPDEPKNPFQVWRSRNPNTPISEWIKLQQTSVPQQPTAYARNVALQEKRRAEWMNLRGLFDEGGMFKGTPQQFVKFKIGEQEFGEQDKTTGEIYQQWIKYMADYNKKDEGEKVMAGAPMNWPTYQAQFKTGGQGRSPTTPAAPATSIPPEYLSVLRLHKSYNDWYNSLSAEDKAVLTPEEIALIRDYYGTVRQVPEPAAGGRINPAYRSVPQI